MDPEVNSFSKADVARILSEYQELTEAVERVVDVFAYIQTGYEFVDLDSWCLSNDHVVEISWKKDRHGCFDYGHFKFPVEYIFKTREELKEITRLKQEELEASKQKKQKKLRRKNSSVKWPNTNGLKRSLTKEKTTWRNNCDSKSHRKYFCKD